jgi:hydroxymethylpyrimidine/phosphomethylpyrimidine kinase
MSVDKLDETMPEEAAEAVEDKYGSTADVYAENRREAAALAGNDKGQAHWKKVAEALREDQE